MSHFAKKGLYRSKVKKGDLSRDKSPFLCKSAIRNQNRVLWKRISDLFVAVLAMALSPEPFAVTI